MQRLSRSELWSLEEYAERRPAFRARVIEHKKSRQVALGEHARLCFEDALTIRYQVQEMLRIEKVFDAAGIDEELAAYNPLIPDGHNWKATFMIEFEDPAERARQLARMVGIERQVWLQVRGHRPVHPIADEDLERDTGEKTSSVHFLRYELDAGMIAAARSGEPVSAGIDHPAHPVAGFEIPAAVRDSLARDLADSSPR